MTRTERDDAGLVGAVHANAGGTVRVVRHDPPLPRGRYSVGHSVMDEAQVRELIGYLYEALGEPAPDAELARLRFIEQAVRGQARAWRESDRPPAEGTDWPAARSLAGIAYRACAQDLEDILSAAGPGPALPEPDHLDAAIEHLVALRDQARLTAGEPA
jgi:hypothetical protein